MGIVDCVLLTALDPSEVGAVDNGSENTTVDAVSVTWLVVPAVSDVKGIAVDCVLVVAVDPSEVLAVNNGSEDITVDAVSVTWLVVSCVNDASVIRLVVPSKPDVEGTAVDFVVVAAVDPSEVLEVGNG